MENHNINALLEDAYQLLERLLVKKSEIDSCPDAREDLKTLKEHLDAASESVDEMIESLN